MSSLRLLVALGCLLTFAAGLVLGLAFDRFGGGAAAAAEPNVTYLRELEQVYGLDPEQVRGVRALLETEERRVDEVLSGVEPQVKDAIQAARRATEDGIRDVLRPEQRERFDRDRAGG